MKPLQSRPAAGAFRTTLALFEAGVDLMRQNLKRAHPDAGEEQIDRLLEAWLHHRPGAEAGDCPGPVVNLMTRPA